MFQRINVSWWLVATKYDRYRQHVSAVRQEATTVTWSHDVISSREVVDPAVTRFDVFRNQVVVRTDRLSQPAGLLSAVRRSDCEFRVKVKVKVTASR